ncbi:MAG: type IV secretion system DNA-binding domain-containing protein [Candidatus Sungiibacteriota bacterium]|uniref:Type IV secretion system DNA-binding domain-containing protein n=1 Tax=Candidatus Sungiibacteriota bacterium TaxID=2750080 RepID=A0A7T5RJP1_9BACT|nr:MAG: type IV secretion system DNA-binding domain-containing protein [Candidatus Sungbacteria bacterium]
MTVKGKANDTTFIGKCNFRGNERVFGTKTNDRRQHMYVIGKTGVGKTALLKNIALQDIRAGRGIGIIDPHGEFVEEVLAQIPAERTNDVIYFNPVDSEFPIGFNVLEVPDPKYKHLVVSDLLGIFTKIWANVWSARMEYILQNCILALLDTPGTTLLGIPRILVDKDYRQKIVAKVQDPVVKSFWIHEYETWRDQFRNEAIVPIQNKVGQFLNTSFIRNIVGQPTSTLNIPEIMNTGKILLVNVSKGKIGEDNSQLLGAMIITKIQLAAMERVRIPEEDRLDYYLYVDEFQNFATESFAAILSEARKYRLNLILAHQYVGQLVTDVSTKVRDAVFGNVGTMITFRVGAADAEFLEKEFMPEFMQQDLIGLPNYNIYLKLMVDGVTSRPFSAVTLPPIQFETDPTVKEKIIKVSRERYARSRPEVEEKITQWSGMVGDDGGGGGSGEEGKYETTCWNCGKTAAVPFKPDGRRPVYCFTCLKQIEEGKLVPLPERMPQVGKARFSQTLGGLGIEFAATAGAGTRPAEKAVSAARPREEERYPRVFSPEVRRPFPERREQKQTVPPRSEIKPSHSRPGLRSQPIVKTPQGARPVSLTELKPREGARKENGNQHPATNVSELRKVLEESLKEKNGSETETKKEKRVIKPGETVKF